MTTRLLEPNIKALVLNHLIDLGELCSKTSVINEFTVDKLSRRADLAIVDDTRMIAFEIKSEADSLKRLTGQVDKYLEYFDKVIIVAATKHIGSILEVVPSNVAVWEISGQDIHVRQRGKIEEIVEKSNLINMMNSNELQRLTKHLDLKPISKKRSSFEESLLDVSTVKLRKAAIDNIRSRYKATNSKFWDSVKSRNITTCDIELLSPYVRIRNEAKLIKKKKEEQWKNWELKLKEEPDILALYQLQKDLVSV